MINKEIKQTTKKDIFEYEPIKKLKLTEQEKKKWKFIIEDIYAKDSLCQKLPNNECSYDQFIHFYLARNKENNQIVIKTKDCSKLKLWNHYLIRQFSSNKLTLSLENEKNFLSDDIREQKLNNILINSINSNRPLGFYLHGDVGIGKTHKIISYCNDMIMKNKKSVVYLFLPQIVREIKDNFNLNNSYNKKIIDKCCDADILIFDDFGAEYISAWFYLDFILIILNYRCEEEKPIIIISNFSMEKLIQIIKKSFASKIPYSDKEVQNVMLSRLIDRLSQVTNQTKYTFDGISRRIN